MKKVILAVLSVLGILGILICVQKFGILGSQGDIDVDRIFAVGTDVRLDDVTEFYYVDSGSNSEDPYGSVYKQTYRFYAEDGGYYFYHEARKAPETHYITTEEDITAVGTLRLSQEEWETLFSYLKDGTVKNLEEMPATTGDRGPWEYLHWKRDLSKYTVFSFASYEKSLEFVDYCVELARKAGETEPAGTDVDLEDIAEFCYTDERIHRLDAHYQRYRFYKEDGGYFLYHETRDWDLYAPTITEDGQTVPLTPREREYLEGREKIDAYRGTDEEDITASGTVPLSREEWETLLSWLKDGMVLKNGTERNLTVEDETAADDLILRLLLHLENDQNDQSVYQMYEFVSHEKRLEFEAYCAELALKTEGTDD